eukprot:COSAG02_NODE_2052_length_9999_cov_5.123636_3_plen_159_part_00
MSESEQRVHSVCTHALPGATQHAARSTQHAAARRPAGTCARMRRPRGPTPPMYLGCIQYTCSTAGYWYGTGMYDVGIPTGLHVHALVDDTEYRIHFGTEAQSGVYGPTRSVHAGGCASSASSPSIHASPCAASTQRAWIVERGWASHDSRFCSTCRPV